jgi:hypothetical protein
VNNDAFKIKPKVIKQLITVTNNIMTLETKNILLEFDLSTYGTLIQLKNLQTLQQFHFHNFDHPFWIIELIDGSQFSSSTTQFFDYFVIDLKAELYYQFNYESEVLEVVLTLQIDTPHPGINLKLETSGSSAIPGIKLVYLPIISDVTQWALTQGKEQIAVPEREGWLITDAITTLNNHWFARDYPGTLSMQFIILAEPKVGGFVISSRDNSSRHKGVSLYSGIHIDWYHYSDNMVFNSGNNFTMDYWVVLNAYKGNTWAVGADQYKEWALDQWYVEKGSIKERNDFPEWLKAIDYVWKGSSYVTDHNTGNIVLEGEQVDNMVLFPNHLTQKGLSSNFLLEWWGWGRDGFDRGYPEYFPARDGDDELKTGINEVHTTSSKVMLYFNGRLVDITTDTYTQNQEYLTGFYDNIYTETYHPYFTAAVADPSSEWWQELVLNFSVKAVKDFNVDVVYLDQISVASPRFDYRDVPSHPSGSGSWWQIAENELLNKTRNAIKEVNINSALASENVLETYLNHVDLFWSYQTSYDMNNWFPPGRTIPLFSFVYHPYVLTSGRPDINPDNFNLFFWGLSEIIKNGYIPGAATLSSPSHFAISDQAYSSLKAAYLTRRTRDFQFFRDGDLLYPIEWDNSPEITISGYSGNFKVPQGIIQGYKNTGSDEFAILFSNRGSKELTWTGNLSNHLLDSGIDILDVKSIQDIVFVENGIEKSMSNFSTSIIDLNIPAYSFIVLLMKSTLSKTSLPYTSLGTLSTKSQKVSGFTFTLRILFFVTLLIFNKKKLEKKKP